MTTLVILAILVALGFLAYKNKDQILARIGKVPASVVTNPAAPPAAVSVSPIDVRPAETPAGKPSQPAPVGWKPGDPVESEEAYQAMLATLSPSTRAMYQTHWSPPPAPFAPGPAPTTQDGSVLTRGHSPEVFIKSGSTLTFQIEPEATRFSIAPHGGGIGNTYALWISEVPYGPALAGNSSAPVSEVSSFSFAAGSGPRWANVRNFGQDTLLFVQTN